MQSKSRQQMVPRESSATARVQVRVRSWKKIKTPTNHIFVLTTMVVSHTPKMKTPALKSDIFLLATTVLSKRVQVANQLHDKTDLQLLAFGRHCVNEINADPLFAVPNPALADINTALDAFELLINEVASGNHAKLEERDAKREEVLNLLADLGNYVETIANDPSNAAVGPVFVIQSAGMRAKVYTAPQRQHFSVKPGKMHGQIDCVAASTENDGTHEWQWRLAAGDPDSWSEVFHSKKSKMSFFGLERGALIIIRHRVVASNHHAIDWEESNSIVVP